MKNNMEMVRLCYIYEKASNQKSSEKSSVSFCAGLLDAILTIYHL